MTRSAEDQRGWRTPWVVFGVMGALLAAYLISLILRPPGEYSPALDGWAVDAFEISASLLGLGAMRHWRTSWAIPLALGLGMLAWSIGDTVLTVESLGGATPPTPSFADIPYLLFYPLVYVALVLLIRKETRARSAVGWLDGTVAGLGAAALLAAFAFHSVLHSTGGNPLGVMTNLAFPIGDLLLGAMVVGGTAVLPGRMKTPWLLVAAGCALTAVGDTFNLFQSSVGSSRVGSIFNAIAWPGAVLLLSMAVWVKPRGTSAAVVEPTPGFVLPGLAAASALAILLTGSLGRVGQVAIGLAAATLAAAGVRLGASLRSLRRLTEHHFRRSVTDELTGLANRRELSLLLDTFFSDHAEGRLPARTLAFLFVDLDHFKEINDSFGHLAGDDLLTLLGPRLNSALRSTDLLVRLGGDELAVVLLDADAEYAATVARKLLAALDQPFELTMVSVRVSASIGIAIAPVDATDSAGLLHCADGAMYRAKSRGSSFEMYEKDIDDDWDRLRMAEELRVAVERHQLELHYQPQVKAGSGQISGVEALVRWNNPRLGFVPPLDFLPLAEETDLMPSITRLVLEAALGQCASWRADGHDVPVSVNITVTDLVGQDFVDLIRSALERHCLPARALVLEITETMIIGDFDRCSRVVEALNDLGVTVSIDDFGAGYTSLAYLSRLDVGEVKLDRSFIARLDDEEGERGFELVRATIALCHALGMRVVAEGVEDHHSLDRLARMGCDIIQGYMTGRPAPAESLGFNRTKLVSPVDVDPELAEARR